MSKLYVTSVRVNLDHVANYDASVRKSMYIHALESAQIPNTDKWLPKLSNGFETYKTREAYFIFCVAIGTNYNNSD